MLLTALAITTKIAHSQNLTWLSKVFLSVIFSLMFLTISTCFNPWMIPDGVWMCERPLPPPNEKDESYCDGLFFCFSWWAAYRDAMSFRASHYFVSYVSEATSAAAGLGANGPDKRGDWQGVQVASPSEVELPRSLREVSRAWNRPMHTWLKECNYA